MKKSADTVDTNTIATVKEEMDLKISEVLIDYYKDVYVNKTNSVNTGKRDYIETKIPTGTTNSGYEFTILGGVVTIIATDNNGLSKDIIGIMEENGEISWGLSSLASQITAVNYGDKVTYSANGITDWRVFYNDQSNVYIITTDYLPAEKIPTETGLENENEYRTSWSSLTIEDLNNTKSGFMFSKMSAVAATSNPNFKATASLLNTNLWTSLKDENGYGEDVIGSPTVEMWIASWNEKYSDTLECQANSTGYQVRANSSSIWAGSIASSVMSAKDGYKVEADKNMYYPRKSPFSDNSNTCYGYWLASPAASGNERVLDVNYESSVGSNFYYNTYYGIRPVVCLKSGVLGISTTVDGVTTWDLSM